MRAGRLRHTVKVQKLANVSDGQGGYTIAWTDIDTIPAEVIPMGGQELLHAGQLEYTDQYRVTIRYRSDITPIQRILWLDDTNTRTLDILTGLNTDGRKRWLIMTAVERVPGPEA